MGANKVGRPPTPAHLRLSEEVAVTLTQGDVARIDAARGDMPRAYFLRRIILAALDEIACSEDVE